MQGNIESAAKWFGSPLVIASLVLASAITSAAWNCHWHPREVSQVKTSDPASFTPSKQKEVEFPSLNSAVLSKAKNLMAVWDNKPKCEMDSWNGGDLVCLAGRVYPVPIGSNGEEPPGKKLVIDLYYETSQEPKNEQKLMERWEIDIAHLKKHWKKDQNGFGYSVLLPWTTYNPNIEKVILVTRYDPNHGFAQRKRSVVTLDHREVKARKTEDTPIFPDSLR